jgi:hypothetical protein
MHQAHEPRVEALIIARVVASLSRAKPHLTTETPFGRERL